MVRPRTFVQVLAALLVAGAGCVKSPTDPSGSSAITGLVSSVRTLAGAPLASQESGLAPAAGSGPTPTVSTISSAINGGSNMVSLHGTGAFSQIIVSAAGGLGVVPGLSEGFAVPKAASGTLSGFYRLGLPTATADQDIIVTFGEAIPVSEFDLLFQLVSPSGAVGPPIAAHMSLLQAGTGVVQVSASWDQLTDVDLHVVEPNQNEVFWFAATSSTGGVLDLDSNQACQIDGKNTENIRWTSGAPAGTYVVRLDYFDRCNLASDTHYVVTVHNDGETTVFTGSFSPGDMDKGNLGAGRTITTFTHAASAFAHELFAAPGAPIASAGSPSAQKIRLSFGR